ncbi:MAG: hypothetical protein ACQEWG_16380 [Bacteroidota bacterium]
MGKLIIERSSEWTNKMLEMGLYLNDSKIGNITDGEIKEMDLEPGKYYLTAKLGIWKSKPIFIEMTSKTVKKVKLSGLYYGEGFLVFCLSVAVVLLLKVVGIIELNPFWIIIGPLIGLSIYYLTLGRKVYIRLIEQN